MTFIGTLFVTMVITVYVPMAGGINGSGMITRSGEIPQTGIAGCGYQFPFGTVFEVVDGDMSQYGLPQAVVCEDRGGFSSYNHLDVALVSSDVAGDLNRAFAWGRRIRRVKVYASMNDYQSYLKARARYYAFWRRLEW